MSSFIYKINKLIKNSQINFLFLLINILVLLQTESFNKVLKTFYNKMRSFRYTFVIFYSKITKMDAAKFVSKRFFTTAPFNIA